MKKQHSQAYQLSFEHMKVLFLAVVTFFAITCRAQNIFPNKLDSCPTDRFCLDCGDQKVEIDQQKIVDLQKNIAATGILNGIKGTVKFQILVDSTGHGCVLSHNDSSGHPLSKEIIKRLNKFDGWIPAKTGNKVEIKTSVNIIAKVENSSIEIKIERVDFDAFKKSFDHPKDPEIFNKNYKYANKTLDNYIFTVFDANNKDIEDNQVDHIAVDNSGNIWFTSGDGLYRREKEKFISSGIDGNTPQHKYFALESDWTGTTWVDGIDEIHSYHDGKWTLLDPKISGISGAYDIISNEQTKEVFFCSDKGLTIYQNGKWNTLNKDKIKGLPSNRVYYAKRDSKGRLWIGTFDGSIMMDPNGNTTEFNNSPTPLKGQCITAMEEDENGNLYFGLYEYDGKKGEVNRNEGIAILSQGKWKHYTTENSGMPFNHTTGLAYDPYQKVLWIATDRAGLVRFDLKDGWENYHNQNSPIPTSYISDIQLIGGDLWLGTRQGLVMIEINESMIHEP